MARYTAADRRADRAYYRAKAGRTRNIAGVRMRKPTRSESRYIRKKYKVGRVTMGKTFRTKRGILGCYKYVGNKRVAFVRKYRR